jgi:hypothetical protein
MVEPEAGRWAGSETFRDFSPPPCPSPSGRGDVLGYGSVDEAVVPREDLYGLQILPSVVGWFQPCHNALLQTPPRPSGEMVGERGECGNWQAGDMHICKVGFKVLNRTLRLEDGRVLRHSGTFHPLPVPPPPGEGTLGGMVLLMSVFLRSAADRSLPPGAVWSAPPQCPAANSLAPAGRGLGRGENAGSGKQVWCRSPF